jgi:hypothetical protein
MPKTLIGDDSNDDIVSLLREAAKQNQQNFLFSKKDDHYCSLFEQAACEIEKLRLLNRHLNN